MKLEVFENVIKHLNETKKENNQENKTTKYVLCEVIYLSHCHSFDLS